MQTYAHAVSVEQPARWPTRFAAIESLLAAVTAAGVVIERAAIPGDSGLDAMLLFADAASDDAFLISRINDNAFMIVRRPRSRIARHLTGDGVGAGAGSVQIIHESIGGRLSSAAVPAPGG